MANRSTNRRRLTIVPKSIIPRKKFQFHTGKKTSLTGTETPDNKLPKKLHYFQLKTIGPQRCDGSIIKQHQFQLQLYKKSCLRDEKSSSRLQDTCSRKCRELVIYFVGKLFRS